MSTPQPAERAQSGAPPVRRLRRRLLCAALVLVAGFGISIVWLLHSQSGAGFVLDRVLAQLDGKLSVAGHSGTLSGPLQLDDLRYRDPASGIEAHVNKIVIKPALLALFSKRVDVQTITIDGMQLDLTSVPEDASKPPTDLSLRAPVEIAIRQLALRDATITLDGETVLVADSLDLIAGWTETGIVVRKLDLRSPDGQVSLNGSLATANGYSGTGETTFNWMLGERSFAGVLKSSSDGKQARLQLDLTQPTAATLLMDVGQEEDAPWTMQLQVPTFEMKKIQPDSTIGAVSVDLHGTGKLRQGSLQGTLSINGHPLGLDPLRYALEDDHLKIETLRLNSPQSAGSFELHGDVGFAARPVSANLVATWEDVELPEDLVGQALTTQGSLDISGDLGGYDARGDLAIGPSGQAAKIGIDIHGSEELITVNTLRLKQDGGGLDAKGTITLQPAIRWQLDAVANRLNPGAFARDWPGALNFVIASSGQMSDQGPSGVFTLESLSGTLRDHPLSGSANLRMDPGYIVDGKLAIKSASSSLDIEGRGGSATDAQIRFDIAVLGDLLPNVAGKLNGNFHVSGKWPQLDVDGEGAASELSVAGTQIGSAELVARIRNLQTPAGALTLKASNITRDDLQFDSLVLKADGNKASHQLSLEATGTPASVHLSLEGAATGADWKGQIKSFDLTPARRNLQQFKLDHPAMMNWDGKRFALNQSCLTGSAQERRRKREEDPKAVDASSTESDEPEQPKLPTRLCVNGSFDEDGSLSGHYQLEHLPLGLPIRLASPDSLVRLRGELNGEGEISKSKSGPISGHAQIHSSDGKLYLRDNANQILLSYTGLEATADFAAESTVVSLRAALDHDGLVDGKLVVHSVGAESQTLDGQLKIDLNSLAFLESITSELVNVQGSLHADYSIAGTLAAPRINGALNLTDFATEVPTAGLKLTQGSISLRGSDSDRFELEGNLTSGSGTLSIAGQGNLAQGTPLTLTIKGENFLAADVPAAQMVITPDLSIERTSDGIFVNGKVTIPSARIDLAKLPGGGSMSASADVVVVDADQPETAKNLPITSNIRVILGDNVALTGFGFDGNIIGELAVNDRPGRVTTGNGALDATGTYAAYGQNLKIESGQVLFANTPIDNPALDIRAVRHIESDGVTAGINVRGFAQKPILTVFTVPQRDSVDAISYLATGKPATNGASFTFGKYLSPKLYLSYGVGLFEPGEVITLRYLFSKKWNFEAINATDGNRAGINYRFEK